jgi:hypothetical protein
MVLYVTKPLSIALRMKVVMEIMRCHMANEGSCLMANDMVLNGCLVALVFGQLLCNPPFLSDALFLRCFFLCENTVSKMLTTTLTSSGAHCPNDRLYWDRVTMAQAMMLRYN